MWRTALRISSSYFEPNIYSVGQKIWNFLTNFSFKPTHNNLRSYFPNLTLICGKSKKVVTVCPMQWQNVSPFIPSCKMVPSRSRHQPTDPKEMVMMTKTGLSLGCRPTVTNTKKHKKGRWRDQIPLRHFLLAHGSSLSAFMQINTVVLGRCLRRLFDNTLSECVRGKPSQYGGKIALADLGCFRLGSLLLRQDDSCFQGFYGFLLLCDKQAQMDLFLMQWTAV